MARAHTGTYFWTPGMFARTSIWQLKALAVAFAQLELLRMKP